MSNRLESLLALPPNWDSYGARTVDPAAVDHAREALALIERLGLPEPATVPTPSGGVQLEWHIGAWDAQIELGPLGIVSVYVSNGEGECEWSAPAAPPTADGDGQGGKAG